MSFLALFPSYVLGKRKKKRKGDEHVTLYTTKYYYQFCLPSDGSVVSMTSVHFCGEILQIDYPVIRGCQIFIKEKEVTEHAICLRFPYTCNPKN